MPRRHSAGAVALGRAINRRSYPDAGLRAEVARGRAAHMSASAAYSELAGSPAGQISTARRIVTISPTSSPSALRAPAFTGTMYRPSFGTATSSTRFARSAP
jgi:hypothetical protein